MRAQTLDWIAVGLAIAFAAAWLGFRFRRNLRKQKEAKGGTGGCGSTCAGCPFGKGCGGKA